MAGGSRGGALPRAGECDHTPVSYASFRWEVQCSCVSTKARKPTIYIMRGDFKQKRRENKAMYLSVDENVMALKGS